MPQIAASGVRAQLVQFLLDGGKNRRGESVGEGDLEQQLNERGIQTLHVGQFDYASVFRERRLGRDQFGEWARDARFANTLSKWDGADSLFAPGPHLTETVAIDATSLRTFPHEPAAGLIIADFSGASKDLMPRQVLKAQLARASALGLEVRAAFEFEMIFVEETAASLREGGYGRLRPFAPDNKCWSGQTAAQEAAFVAGLEKAIRSYDIALFAVGGELGPGCFEATLAATDGLRSADDAGFFRQATRAYARDAGLTASFMPSMGENFPGLGGHLSLSLIERKSGRNLFASADGRTSVEARSFIAGMMQVVPGAFALCAHTVNAYRRFAPGTWAPKSLTWAEWTFTTAVRSVPSSGEGARLEFRLPGADCNPHLTLALMLAAGLDGLENSLDVPEAEPNREPNDVPPGAQRFPQDLASAAHALRSSPDARRLFGERFVDHFATACEVEHASLARAVSQSETKRYLEG